MISGHIMGNLVKDKSLLIIMLITQIIKTSKNKL